MQNMVLNNNSAFFFAQLLSVPAFHICNVSQFTWHRKPDLLELIDIIENAQMPGCTWDLKILVLHRHPHDTVLSTVRRGFVTNENCLKQVHRGSGSHWFKGGCDAVLYLAKEAELVLTFLNAELSTLSAQYFRVINYTNFIHHPHTFVQPISRFLRLSPFSKRHLAFRLHTKIKKQHTTHQRLADPAVEFLDSFFTDTRDQRWNLLGGQTYDIERLDGLGANQTGESALGYRCL
eukprot:m.160195 g.160195  ORF g.160195 m.160195 type:complete len:234 (+) comp18015_c0_seq1:1536-2237(+)